jgi:chromate transporter
MTHAAVLNAVAFGQITPGPVTHTVAAVGYAAGGLGGGLLAAAFAFAPSFVMIGLGARRFERLRANISARAFLDGAGPAAIGAILGAAVPLANGLAERWQVGVAVAAAAALLARRPPIVVLVAAAALGGLAVLAGGEVPR